MVYMIFAFGLVIGSIFTGLVFRAFQVGTLRIGRIDPDDDPYLFLELSKDLSKVSRKTHVILKVDTRDFISRK